MKQRIGRGAWSSLAAALASSAVFLSVFDAQAKPGDFRAFLEQTCKKPTPLANCDSDYDCDGIDDGDDACPGISYLDASQVQTEVNGFLNPCCFAHAFPPNEPPSIANIPADVCVPVAFRPSDSVVPADPLKVASNQFKKHITGGVFVGVVDVGAGTFDAPPEIVALGAASASQVHAAMLQGKVPNNALFSCLVAVGDTEDTSVATSVFGYKVAAAYVHSIHEAALLWAKAAPGSPMLDQLGLITATRKGVPKFHDALVGTHGTMFWEGLWSTDPSVLLDVTGLPQKAVYEVDQACKAVEMGKLLAAKSQPTKPSLTWDDLLFDPFDPGGYFKAKGKGIPGFPNPAPKDPPKPWDQPWLLTEKNKATYTETVGASHLKKRLTGFGPTPVLTKKALPLFGPALPQPGWKIPKPPKAPVVGAKPPPPPPPKPPPNEFSEAGIVLSLDTLGSIVSSGAIANHVGKFCVPLDPQGSYAGVSFPQCACKLLDSQPVFVFNQGFSEVLVSGDGSYDLYKTFLPRDPAPRVMMRGLAKLTEQMGSDTKVDWQFNQLTGATLLSLVRNLTTPMSSQFVPGSAWIEADAGYADPYKAGTWVNAVVGKDWQIITGTGFSALRALGLHGLDQVTEWEAMSMHAISNRLGTWPGAGNVDYQEVALPKAQWKTGAATDFAAATDAVVAYHKAADTWNPGGDAWLTNYGNDAAFAGRVAPAKPAGFAGNPANALAPEWSPMTKDALGPMADYDTRLDACSPAGFFVSLDPSVYTPYKIDKHWPKLRDNVPMSGLYARAPLDGAGNPGGIFEHDLVHRAVTQNGTGILVEDDNPLHQGLDVNWDWNLDSGFVNPAYGDPQRSAPARSCYGKPFIKDVQDIPMSCEDAMFTGNKCTEEQLNGGTCNYANVLFNKCSKAKDAIGDACGYIFLPEIVCDAAEGIANSVCEITTQSVAIIQAVVSTACLVITGGPCSQLDMNFAHARNPPKRMLIEMEHQFAYLVPGAANDTQCNAAVFGAAPECQWGDWSPPNGFLVPNTPGLGNILSTDQNLIPTYGKIGPFVLAPGLVGHNGSAYNEFVRAFGSPGFDLVTDVAQPPVPPSATLEAQATGLRADFVGDGIADCGHHPFSPEIHPPHSMMLHASTASMAAKRYSLLAVNRWSVPTDTMASIFHLWSAPRTSPAQVPVAKTLNPVGGTVPSGLKCTPYPAAWPTRVLCSFEAPPTHTGSFSAGQRRLLPMAGASAGGGLLEVSWK